MKKHVAFAGLLVVIGVLSRLIPHVNNFTPVIALGLMSGALYSRRMGIMLMLATMLLSDLLLSYTMHYPFMGSWTAFTYTGVIAAVLLGAQVPKIESRWLAGLVTAIASGLGFWVWTNLGVWLTSSMYMPHSIASLSLCYVNAIPFLQHQLLGSLVWMAALMAAVGWMKVDTAKDVVQQFNYAK